MEKTGILSIIQQATQAMRIRLTLSQLKRILASEPLKYPISFKKEDLTDVEFSEFQKLLQMKERG